RPPHPEGVREPGPRPGGAPDLRAALAAALGAGPGGRSDRGLAPGPGSGPSVLYEAELGRQLGQPRRGAQPGLQGTLEVGQRLPSRFVPVDLGRCLVRVDRRGPAGAVPEAGPLRDQRTERSPPWLHCECARSLTSWACAEAMRGTSRPAVPRSTLCESGGTWRCGDASPIPPRRWSGQALRSRPRRPRSTQRRRAVAVRVRVRVDRAQADRVARRSGTRLVTLATVRTHARTNVLTPVATGNLRARNQMNVRSGTRRVRGVV